jgi:hypothetical protein
MHLIAQKDVQDPVSDISFRIGFLLSGTGRLFPTLNPELKTMSGCPIGSGRSDLVADVCICFLTFRSRSEFQSLDPDLVPDLKLISGSRSVEKVQIHPIKNLYSKLETCTGCQKLCKGLQIFFVLISHGDSNTIRRYIPFVPSCFGTSTV